MNPLAVFCILLASLASAQQNTTGNASHPSPSTTYDVGSTHFWHGEEMYGTCGRLWYTKNQTTENSPLVQDCLQLLHNIGKGGRWTTHTRATRELARYNTCHFSIKDVSSASAYFTFYVEMADIRHAIMSSIKQFSSGERVAAQGRFRCRGWAWLETAYHRWDVLWKIY